MIADSTLRFNDFTVVEGSPSECRNFIVSEKLSAIECTVPCRIDFRWCLHGIVETTENGLRIFQKLNLNQTFRNGTNVVVSEVVQQLYSHRV